MGDSAPQELLRCPKCSGVLTFERDFPGCCPVAADGTVLFDRLEYGDAYQDVVLYCGDCLYEPPYRWDGDRIVLTA